MSRQIWTNFLVQKRFQLLGCKIKSIQEGWQERVSTGPKSYYGRSRFQPVYAIERLRNQLDNAAEYFAREENLTPVLIPTKSKDMDEQLKMAYKVVDVVDRANRKICETLLRYNVESLRVLMLKSDYLQGRRRTRSFNKLSM